MHRFLRRHPLITWLRYAFALGSLAVATTVLAPDVVHAASPSPSPNTGGAASAAPSSSAPKTAGFGLGPATARALDDRTLYQWSASPGGTLTDHVAIVNYGTQPLTLDLYARDASNAPNGALSLQAKDIKPTDAGSWITIEIPGNASTVTVPARSTVIAPLLLTVPRNASPGDHTAGVIVSLTAKATATNGAQTVAPNFEQRVAVPVDLRISGALRPSLSVQSLRSAYEQNVNPVGRGTTTVTYRVVNTGNVNLGGQQHVTVSGLFGSVHAKAPDIPVLLPGNAIAVTLKVHGVLPKFLMSTEVAVVPATPAGDVDPGLVGADASKHFWAVPWMLLGIIVALVVIWRVSRRVRGRGSRHGGRGTNGGRRRRGNPTAHSSTIRKPVDHDPGSISVTNSSARVVRRVGLAAIAVVIAMAAPAGSALASSGLPYTDSNAQGSIGLCDKNGNNITHGSVYDKPFAWKAVSAEPAPPSLRGSGRSATLYAYQPRKGVDPSYWSGEQLTATSAYSDPAIPIAQATDRDIALSDDLNDFPPQWNKLVQLRMYFSALSAGVQSTTYPVGDIRVDGTTWTLVDGAKVDCKTGSAISMEAALPSSNPAGLKPPQLLSTSAAKAVGAAVPKGSAVSTKSSASSEPPSSAGPAAGTTSAAAAAGLSRPSAVALAANGTPSNRESGKNHSGLVVVAVVVVVLAGFATWYWRRSRASGPS